MKLNIGIAICSIESCALRMGVRSVGAPRVRGGVRREQAGELQGHDHQDGVGQSPHLDAHPVKNASGATENWAIEAGTPNVLFRRGFTRDTLKVGTEVVVDGYRAKDGSRRANGRDVTFADGRKLFLGSSGIGAPYELKGGAQK